MTPSLGSLALSSRAFREGAVTSVQLVEQALSAATCPWGEGGRTFTRINESAARRQALRADARFASGIPQGILAGMPITIKDLFDVEGEVTQAGSASLENAKPATRDAIAIARMKASGAVIVGRTNMTEFAFSGIGINPHFGTPLNPFDRAKGRIPGGSSSGAAISVSDGMAVAALGTDTGGSIRIPAALCGLVGFKPTARRIPLDGTLPLSPSLDSVGSIAHSVTCCALLDSLLAGESIEELPHVDIKGLRLGVVQGDVLDDLEKPVAFTFESSLSTLSVAGAQIIEINFAALPRIRECNQNGGLAAADSYAWHCARLDQCSAKYDPRVLSRILRGRNISQGEIQELLRAREQVIADAEGCFAGFDALLMPTVPRVAPLLADIEKSDAAFFDANAAMLRNPSVINFIDGCALSIRCHLPGDAPVGLMVAATRGKDHQVLRVGNAIEKLLAQTKRMIAAQVSS